MWEISGRNCKVEIKECVTGQPCPNGDTFITHKCALYNISGRNCEIEINECVTRQPCLNGGTCFIASSGGYQCSCPLGFMGRDCEAGDCLYCICFYLLSPCVCVCVCVCVCMCVCVCVRAHAHACELHACLSCLFLSLYLSVCPFVFLSVCLFLSLYCLVVMTV